MTKQVILCVDDENTVLRSLKAELQEAMGNNYRIEIAQGGEEALELIEELLEDGDEVLVIISDHIMPDMKGDELLRRVHLILPKTIKIMLTGQADIEAVGNAIKYAKLYRYIAKPWQAEDMNLTIREAVNSYFQDKRLTEQTAKLIALNQAFSRFVPRQFLHILGKDSILTVKLGDHVQQEMSVLFSDIRDFTAISEGMSPQDNFKFINAYLSRMEPIIIKNQGFIDKYMGDGIMALFSRIADDAVKAGIVMLRRLAEYNQERANSGYEPIKIGIGINTGSLMLGTVGGHNRMDSTVISDAVNLASRLEELTKYYGVSLLISHQTFARLQDPMGYSIRFIGQVQVRGKSNFVAVFEVFDGDDLESKEQKLATLTIFEEALWRYFQGAFSEAVQLLERVLKIHPRDTVALRYLELSRELCEKG